MSLLMVAMLEYGYLLFLERRCKCKIANKDKDKESLQELKVRMGRIDSRSLVILPIVSATMALIYWSYHMMHYQNQEYFSSPKIGATN